MDILQRSVAQQLWVVVPCTNPLAFGVPLYSYFDASGELIFTSVTPFRRAGEVEPNLTDVFVGVREHAELDALLGATLEGAPREVVDSIRATLTHKRFAPLAKGATFRLVDPDAGVVHTATGDVAGLLIGTCGGVGAG